MYESMLTLLIFLIVYCIIISICRPQYLTSSFLNNNNNNKEKHLCKKGLEAIIFVNLLFDN